MKKFYTILCIAIASLTQLQAQAPQGFNYQATVRNSSGDLIVNTNVNFKFSITQGSQTPYTAYSEDHTPSTDDLGQVSLVIGQGNPITGIFSDIDWSIGNYYLAIELDTGSGYVAMGTTQLLSVPYALYAENSGNSTPTTPNLEEVLAENNSANSQQIKNLQDPTEAQDAVTLAYVLAQIDQINLNIDHDGDGFSENNGDCDDTNAQVNPGATEIEDGVDNDCDGDIDEGFDASGTVTDIDGNTYDYLTYGDQVWTVENAEMVTYRDGTEIPQVTDPTQWSNLTTGAWCYYNNDPTKPRLYNWYAVMGIHDTDPTTPNKLFAPEGWHVPTDAEWTTLENYLIANGYNYDGTTTGNKIAKAMASTTGWNSSTNTGAIGNDQSLNNSSNFNAFPEGIRSNNGPFWSEGDDAVFWTITEYYNTGSAWSGNLYNFNPNLVISTSNKRCGFSVRFVRD